MSALFTLAERESNCRYCRKYVSVYYCDVQCHILLYLDVYSHSLFQKKSQHREGGLGRMTREVSTVTLSRVKYSRSVQGIYHVG